MEISGKAYFVSDPRRIEDLTVLHLVEWERLFEVAKTVKLTKIDYENFITDMVAIMVPRIQTSDMQKNVNMVR